jgi:hypothetical protein
MEHEDYTDASDVLMDADGLPTLEQLADACKDGDVRQLARFLDAGCDVNLILEPDTNDTLLHVVTLHVCCCLRCFTCSCMQRAMILLVVELKAAAVVVVVVVVQPCLFVHACSLLQTAANTHDQLQGHNECVQLLLRRGAIVESDPPNPFHYACELGLIGMIRVANRCSHAYSPPQPSTDQHWRMRACTRISLMHFIAGDQQILSNLWLTMHAKSVNPLQLYCSPQISMAHHH